MIPSKRGDCLQISYKFVRLQRGARGAARRGVCNSRAPAWVRSRGGAWASSCGAETGACQWAWGSHWGKDPEISPFAHTCWHSTCHARGQPGKTTFIHHCLLGLSRVIRPAFVKMFSHHKPDKWDHLWSQMLFLFQPSSWASVTSKNLPPGGVVPATGVPPHVVRVPSAQVDVHNQRFHLRNIILGLGIEFDTF